VGTKSAWMMFTVACVVTFGCGYSRPLLGPQGTIQQQRSEAAIYDPYVANDLGPAVVGGRPRDFQQPLSQPVRQQWPFGSWFNTPR
jgi:hypothetical protein